MMQRALPHFHDRRRHSSAGGGTPAQAQQAGARAADAGSRVYATNCVVCHQAGGTGVAGAFPPLAGHVPDLLKRADGRTYLGKVLLFGLEGEINVNGNALPARCRRGVP